MRCACCCNKGPTVGGKNSAISSPAGSHCLFLQVSDLGVHRLLLPLVQDLDGHIRVRRGIGHDARQVIHFFDLVRAILVCGSRSLKGVGQGHAAYRAPWPLNDLGGTYVDRRGLKVPGYSRKNRHLGDWDLSGGRFRPEQCVPCSAGLADRYPTPRARPSMQSRNVSEHTGSDRCEVVNRPGGT
jgi:hypothetical protein